jgi:hypothetical protein
MDESTPMKVWLTTITHKYGTDVYCARDSERLDKAIISYCNEYIVEAPREIALRYFAKETLIGKMNIYFDEYMNGTEYLDYIGKTEVNVDM